MQNIDFSRKIRREPVLEAERPDLGKKNRTVVTTLVLCILAFTLGLMAGVQLMRVRGTDSLVKNPDRPARTAEPEESPSNPSSAKPSRVGVEDPDPSAERMADTAPAKYLIKVGTFSSADADRLARKIGKVAELKDVVPAPCKGLKEQSDRGLTFRIAVKGEPRENVFLGCFADPGKAHEALSHLKGAGIPQAASAVVFEIE